MFKESDIHVQFSHWLNKANVPFDHSRTDKRTRTKVGQPDFVLFNKGRVLFVEVKTLGNVLRPEQKKRKEQLEAAGCRVVVAYSLEECVHAATTWLGSNGRDGGLPMRLREWQGKPLDCVGVDGRNGRGKADTR